MKSFYQLGRTFKRVSNREVTVLVTIKKHQTNGIEFAAYINTGVKSVHCNHLLSL